MRTADHRGPNWAGPGDYVRRSAGATHPEIPHRQWQTDYPLTKRINDMITLPLLASDRGRGWCLGTSHLALTKRCDGVASFGMPRGKQGEPFIPESVRSYDAQIFTFMC